MIKKFRDETNFTSLPSEGLGEAFPLRRLGGTFKSLIIGITGGIGGGKSTLAGLLREKGCFVFDTDFEAKRLQNEDAEVRRRMMDLFGNEIYDETGNLNRKKLAGLVFKNQELLSELNQIIHPIVRLKLWEWQQKYAGERYLFVESAIMFESGLYKLMDKIVVVTAPEDIRISRVVKRDKLTVEQVRARIANQMPEDIKIKKADIVLDSNENQALSQSIDNMFSELEKF